MLQIMRTSSPKTRLTVTPTKTVINLGAEVHNHILDIVDEVVKHLGTVDQPFHGTFSFRKDAIEINMVSEDEQASRQWSHNW